MKACLFAGPTLYGCHPRDWGFRGSVFGPAALGSVYQAVQQGFRQIGIIDGYFGNVPSVWHKEILYALSQGAAVFGAASTGALRAAELYPFGMTGVGAAFRLFRSGYFTDDDEVCIVHADESSGYRPLSEPLLNLRFTLRRLRRQGRIGRAAERTIVGRLKSEHFSARTIALAARFTAAVSGCPAPVALAAVEEHYVDQKRRDALSMVRAMSRSSESRPPALGWRFPETSYWRLQFQREYDDLPSLRPTSPRLV